MNRVTTEPWDTVSKMDFLRKYKWHILSVLVTLIAGALVVGVWAVQRQNVTDDGPTVSNGWSPTT
jgi:hypothetical protein